MPEKIKEELKAEEKRSAGAGTCGFENKQYFGDSGKKMTCVLQKDHSPEVVALDANGQPILQVIHRAPYPEEGADEKVLVAFSDAAGTPPDKGTLAKIEAEKARKEAKAKAAAK